ncbi:unnamed protein product [Orchesella dallaii]|uniref:Uncharacterized protein n=1 Tax=Orchesella dallaii TaxID=48710 RepID=A0ABP1QQN8_9HEXA
MTLVNSCCGLFDLRSGSKYIAIISMIYDLIITASLLLCLLLHVPLLRWVEPPQDPYPYQILLIATIAIQALHSIPSFLLLYATWEEATRGTLLWLFMTFLSFFVHLAWIPIPFLFEWKLDRMVITVTFVSIASLVIFYSILCVISYRQWVLTEAQGGYSNSRAKRRLVEQS